MIFGQFWGGFQFGRPGEPKAPPRVDFSSQKRQKRIPFWRPKSRFLASFFGVFFAWILHGVLVAILKDLGSQMGGKSIKKRSRIDEKNPSIFVCILGPIFLDFSCFSGPLGSRKLAKTMGGVSFF